MNLAPASFAEFFRGVHAHPLFHWQARLLHPALRDGWPSTGGLPTASGKTAVIEVAV